MRRGTALLFSGLFFLSGMAGLVYEVCWTRLLRLPMGNTVYSMTAVLTAFMGGLALGSWLAGRWIDRRGNPLRVYALLEAGIGIFCLALPWIVGAEEPLFRWIYRGYGTTFLAFNLLKFAACGLVVLVPATLMGATLPVLCRYFMDDAKRIGLSIGWLYAVNAFGAVAGSLLAGFVLIPGLGQRGAMLLGVAISLTVASVAGVAQRYLGSVPLVRPATNSAPIAPPRSAAARTVLVGYGISGLSAMVLQIAWFRVLSLLIGSSVYAFALLVSAFILGLAVGSTAVARFADRLRRPALGFAGAELGIGVTALAMLPVFQRYPDWMVRLVPDLSQHFGRFQLVQFGLVFVTLLLPTACMGACLPLVGRAVVRDVGHAGEGVGTAYSSNALGTILGAFLGGFVVLPGLGTHHAILVGAGLNLIVGLVLLAMLLPWRRSLVVAIPVAAIATVLYLLVPRFDPVTLTSGSYLYAEQLREQVASGGSLGRVLRGQSSILMHREGLTTDVSVKENVDGVRVLAINGKVDASDGADMATQLLSGHLACLMHPEPRDVAVLGLASGVTLHSVSLYPSVRSLECIEIAPEMVEACRLFDHVNGRVLDDPRVKLVIQDGRNHLTLTDHQYDVIVSEPSNPWSAGIASLYTREFLQACRERLRPRGVMCIWVHIYRMDLPTFSGVVRTFAQVFPNATLWETVFAADYVLVGSRDALEVRWEDLSRRLAEPKVAEDLARMRIRTPAELLVLAVADSSGVRELGRRGAIFDDDRNRLEFDAPRLMYHRTTEDEIAVLQNLRRPGVPSWLRPPPGGLPGADRSQLEAAQAAQRDLWRGMVHRMNGRSGEALRSFVAALERCPRLPGLSTPLLETAREIGSQAEARGNKPAAESLYRHILELAPDLAGFHEELGLVLVDRGQGDAALEEFRQASKLEPRNTGMRLNLATSLAQRGQLDAAAAQLRTNLQQRAGDVPSRLGLAKILLDAGQVQVAERECRQVVADDPGIPDAWLLLAETLRRQGHGEEADRALATARKVTPR
jgi:spermidine synthase